MSGRVLVVDDEPNLREVIRIVLEDEGFVVREAADLSSASAALAREHFDLVICDILLPDGSGLDLLRAHGATTSFAMITAHTTPATLLSAVRQGAVEYLSKPFDIEQLKKVVAKRLHRLVALTEASVGDDLVGVSSAMRPIKDRVAQIARSDATVLITGESGTGKELLAKTIHAASPRAAGPFLAVNCGALPEGLLESELFGHVRGSFTGAVRDRRGLLEEANGGTLFLDEVGEMPPVIQVKLLRVLQERTIERVGESLTRRVDVRVIAATHRDLTALAREGLFREDLYYRLKVFPIHLPPLRERKEDIGPLTEHFVRLFRERTGKAITGLTPDAMRMVMDHAWPGNVRELENAIAHGFVTCAGGLIGPFDLPVELRRAGVCAAEPENARRAAYEGPARRGKVTRDVLVQALEATGWNKAEAARRLGMDRTSVWRHMKALGVPLRPEPP